MAATGFTPISLYYSTTASAVPTAGNLANGELALNIADMKLYAKNSSGTVTLLASNAATTPISPLTANGVVYVNGSSLPTSGSALTFDGTSISLTGSSGLFNALSGAGFRLQNSAATANWNLATSGLDLQTRTSQAGSVQWLISDAEQMRLTSTGLGIGTSSPAAKLDVKAADASNAIRLTATTGTNGSYQTFTNTGNTLYVGTDSSTGAALGFGAYAAGMYSTTKIVFQSASASNSLTLNTSGNLGLGVTPSAWGSGYKAVQVNGAHIMGSSTNLYAQFGVNNYFNGTNDVYISNGYALSYQQASGQHRWFTSPSGTAGNAITFTQAMTLDASGNLGIGTSSPSYKLQVNFTEPTTTSRNGFFMNTSATNSEFALWRTGPTHSYAGVGASQWWLYHYNSLAIGSDSASAVITFVTNAAERARISAAGGFSVGTTADPGAGAIYATGNITAYYSDDRLKTRLGNIENALDKVDQLQGFYYEANETAQALGYKVKREVGVSAQSVQAVLPEIVSPAPIDQQYLTVDYERLVPLLIEAVKELRAEVKALKGV